MKAVRNSLLRIPKRKQKHIISLLKLFKSGCPRGPEITTLRIEKKISFIVGKNDEKVCGIYIQTVEFFSSYYHAERGAVD